MRRVCGAILIAVPFAVIIGSMIAAVGWVVALGIFGVVALVFASIVLGVYLLKPTPR